MGDGLFVSSRRPRASRRHACHTTNDNSSGCTRKRRLGAAETALRRRAGTLPGSQQQAQSRSPAWLEFQPVARLDGRPQTPDLVPPSRNEAVELGVLAVGPHTALAERELMLRIYQRRRCSSSYPVDAARPKHAIADDLLILAGCHRMADFLRQLLADHSPFPRRACCRTQRAAARRSTAPPTPLRSPRRSARRLAPPAWPPHRVPEPLTQLGAVRPRG